MGAAGADRAKIGEVKAARDEIAKAMAINPNAHFGREKYQLRALEWIIDPPRAAGRDDLPNLLGWSLEDVYGQKIDPKDADDAVRGLAGLIVLGNAWESVDVFHALGFALQADSLGFEKNREGGRNTLAYLAWLRCRELIDAGKGSMLPDAPKGDALKAMIRRARLRVWPTKLLDPAFVDLRAEADAWHAARTAFMMGRLNEGRHPDTDPHFWDGYTERPAPGLPATSDPQAYHARRMWAGSACSPPSASRHSWSSGWSAARCAPVGERSSRLTTGQRTPWADFAEGRPSPRSTASPAPRPPRAPAACPARAS